jgi:hypothetical protein
MSFDLILLNFIKITVYPFIKEIKMMVKTVLFHFVFFFLFDNQGSMNRNIQRFNVFQDIIGEVDVEEIISQNSYKKTEVVYKKSNT